MKLNKKNILLFFSVLGPGIITANVDNDAGGIATYSVAGATFGYSLLWTLVPITIALIVVQEMCARMGVVSGKSLADMIRENFGVKITAYLMLFLVLADFGDYMNQGSAPPDALDVPGMTVEAMRAFASAAERFYLTRECDIVAVVVAYRG